MCAIKAGPSWGALAFSIIGTAIGAVVTVTCVDAVGSPLSRRTCCKTQISSSVVYNETKVMQ